MIKRVFGKIDGVTVEFQHAEGDFYKINFPLKINSGNYIVDVYAEDQAGNKSFCSKLLCVIDPEGACIHCEKYENHLEVMQTDTLLELTKITTILEYIPPQRCERRRHSNMVEFIKGEDKHVKFRVHSAKKENMIVESATFVFTRYGEIEKEGVCGIENDGWNCNIDIKLDPKEKGTYCLEITYIIADEILKHREEIKVI